MQVSASLSTPHRREMKFASSFLLIFAGFQFIYSSLGDSAVQRLLIEDLTVQPCAMIINAVAPQEHVQAFGHSLVSPWARLNVLSGCEGIESILLIVAALCAYRLSLQAKIKGVLSAIGLMYLVNQIRLVTLYFSYRYNKDLFALIHGYIGPTLIMAIGTAFFLWWITKHPVVKP